MKKNPFPNEHAARQAEPDGRRYKTYRRKEISPGISFIYGIKRPQGTEIQSIRFNKDKFTPKQAKEWLKKHKFKSSKFSAAKIPKSRKNPRKPLKFYLDQFNQKGFILPENIIDEEILIISNAGKKFGFNVYKKIGEYKNGEIFLCFLVLDMVSYVYGIIELYPDHIEYHTFEINNKSYKKEEVLQALNKKLYTYFIEKI
jgi:hypothetical protein